MLRLAIVQSLGQLVLKTHSAQTGEEKEEENGANSQRRKSLAYQQVMQKRASILVRRQSVVASGEKEKDRDSDTENGRETSSPSGPISLDLNTTSSILQLMRERGRDVNAFVRGASLRTLALLCGEGLIPLSEYVQITEMALERVKDKAVLVRKNAITVCELKKRRDGL